LVRSPSLLDSNPQRDEMLIPALFFDGNRKYESGAVGQFIHLAALQGTAYSCELEVYAGEFGREKEGTFDAS